MIKFVSDLVVFSVFSSTNKTADCHDITEILLKVALNIKPKNPNPLSNDHKDEKPMYIRVQKYEIVKRCSCQYEKQTS
jgi:hypothetical protein